ncbi:MAG TPA: PAS domain S-box protein [Verrucomicrobiae bacterium]|jgi:PAS domain S-box-containing protein|nr:PAS domain S-box protein [Verrucomicrobiae bacterium]
MSNDLSHLDANRGLANEIAQVIGQSSPPAAIEGRLLAASMDALGAGVLLCEAKSPDCPIIYVSKGFSVISRYTTEDALGQKLAFIISAETDPEARARIEAALAGRAASQEEFRCRRHQAEPIWCELNLTPVFAGGETPTHFIALITDISDHKEREEILRDAQSRYGGIFENAVEGIYQSTPDGRYLAVNPALARMYGYDNTDELLHRVCDISQQIYVDPVFRERFQREVEQNGQIRGFEYQVRRRDGSIIWISESARAVRDADGRTRYYEGFIEDISQRKEAEVARARLEKQMIQAQKMEAIGTLAGGIAHDFNNILCAMLGLTELALTSTEVTGVTRKNLEAVLRSAGRAKDLIRQILTFSRRGENESSPIRLGLLLKECVKLLNASLPSSIKIVLNIETDDDTVIADATEMHQVIMNLGTNAAHAMKRTGGQLEYTLRSLDLNGAQAARLSPLRAGKYLCLTARDSGHGMTRETMDNIFDPFFTTKPAGEGTGLGLTLVQRIVARCGGHLEVESELGTGTTFQIYLPRAPQNAVVAAPRKEFLLPGRRERILVVDDEIPILDMLQQRLRKVGYRVTTRADSTTALETFQAEPEKFDLVITDHTMPCMQGAELAERLGQIRADVPVILMTGLNQPPSFAGSHFAARRAVLRKPLDFVDLSQRMREMLESAGKA